VIVTIDKVLPHCLLHMTVSEACSRVCVMKSYIISPDSCFLFIIQTAFHDKRTSSQRQPIHSNTAFQNNNIGENSGRQIMCKQWLFKHQCGGESPGAIIYCERVHQTTSDFISPLHPAERFPCPPPYEDEPCPDTLTYDCGGCQACTEKAAANTKTGAAK
jgi:hypothetical protein